MSSSALQASPEIIQQEMKYAATSASAIECFSSPRSPTDSIPELPRGAITEIAGPVSSGRTAFLHAVLAEAGRRGECYALVDAQGMFDPLSAAKSGVDLGRLLWVRGSSKVFEKPGQPTALEKSVRAADLILHAGGFGVVVLDLCEVANRDLNTIPLSYWYRFRRAVEHTPARFLVMCHVPLAKACAQLSLAMRRDKVDWRGSKTLFDGLNFAVETRRQRVRMAG